MRKSVCILSILVLVGAIAGFAQTGSTGSATGSTASAGTGSTGSTGTTGTTTHKGGHKHKGGKTAMGTVAGKDDTAKTFKLHPKTGADWTFDTNDSTKYWLNGKTATWADLADGQHATVGYKADGDKKVATSVKLKAPKEPKKAS